MADISIEVRGASRIIAALQPARWQHAMRLAVRSAALEVKGVISQYPPDTNAHRPQPFVSTRQRRFFFAALAAGEIEVPYRRGISPGSEALGRRWTSMMRDEGLTAVIGNRASYAPLVQGDGTQTAYHAVTGWRTVGQVADDMRGRVAEIVDMFVDGLIRGM